MSIPEYMNRLRPRINKTESRGYPRRTLRNTHLPLSMAVAKTMILMNQPDTKLQLTDFRKYIEHRGIGHESRLASLIPCYLRGTSFEVQLTTMPTKYNGWTTEVWTSWFTILNNAAWKQRQNLKLASTDIKCCICWDKLERKAKLQPKTCKHVFHAHVSSYFIRIPGDFLVITLRY